MNLGSEFGFGLELIFNQRFKMNLDLVRLDKFGYGLDKDLEWMDLGFILVSSAN